MPDAPLTPGEMESVMAEEAAGEEERISRRGDRRISIIEASLLAIVAVLAALSGYAAARWSTDSSDLLAHASAERTLGNAANVDALNTLNFDVTAFNAWFAAYVAQNQTAMNVAARRFTPNFKNAFEAWLLTSPETNPTAPPGPTYMPQYKQPEKQHAAALNAAADRDYEAGVKAGDNSDSYILITVYLATVLFLAGIGSHFAYRRIRYALAGVGSAILVLAVVLLAISPKPA
ncbi:MAG: hypothetical protein JOZ75_05250 [Candidatus Dormibacteraeota bacterium]|nr:hypothetical protein [Candidatus Dormibacteraeota bacterium]